MRCFRDSDTSLTWQQQLRQRRQQQQFNSSPAHHAQSTSRQLFRSLNPPSLAQTTDWLCHVFHLRPKNLLASTKHVIIHSTKSPSSKTLTRRDARTTETPPTTAGRGKDARRAHRENRHVRVGHHSPPHAAFPVFHLVRLPFADHSDLLCQSSFALPELNLVARLLSCLARLHGRFWRWQTTIDRGERGAARAG